MTESFPSIQSEAIFSREEVLQSAQEILATYAKTYRVELPKIFTRMWQCVDELGDPAKAPTALSMLKRDVHDMKGQGAMFGFPALSVAAGDFYRVLGGCQPSPASRVAIETYIKALERMAAEPTEDPISDQI